MIKIDYTKYWNDPVWSKVIANSIIFLLSQLGIFFYGLSKRLNFIDVYKRIFHSLSKDYMVSGWLILFFLVVLTFLIIRIFINLKSKRGINELKQNSSQHLTAKTEKAIPDVHKNDQKKEILEIIEASTVFFHQRFCDAFPGLENGIHWFESQKEIQNRLKVLLAHPLKFDKVEGHGITADPIWWFRGSSALFIFHFEILDRKKVLMNIDELLIQKIAAFRGKSYYQDYVYVQCKADKPTGLYQNDPATIKSLFNEYVEYKEEFGVFKNKFVSRREHDDGSSIIKGKPTSIIGSKLRTRNLTSYNFVIAAKDSPYNCYEFDRNSEERFIQLLKEESGYDNFFEWMKKFPKNRLDD